MTTFDVIARLRDIHEAAFSGDFERAHVLEDRMRADVLSAIAEGFCSDAQRLAEFAMLSVKIKFTRACS